MGALRPRAAAAVLPLVLLVPVASAQPDPASAFQLTAFAGVLRVGSDLATEVDAQWTPIGGGRLGWRPTPQVTLAGEGWLGSIDGADLVGLGAHAIFRPWIGRGWPADLAFDFGLERVDASDDEDRSLGFVFGLGVEKRLARRVVVETAARHHFLTVDEEEVDGVATGRDAEMWELRAGLSFVFGGEP